MSDGDLPLTAAADPLHLLRVGAPRSPPRPQRVAVRPVGLRRGRSWNELIEGPDRFGPSGSCRGALDYYWKPVKGAVASRHQEHQAGGAQACRPRWRGR